MTDDHIDWTLVGLGLILVVVVGAVIARLRTRRARAAVAAGPLGPVVDDPARLPPPTPTHRHPPTTSGKADSSAS